MILCQETATSHFLLERLSFWGVISTSAVAQSNMTATRDAYAYDQVFTNSQASTCPNPKHRKVKTSKGYKWRWAC
jgi:hypothetical protein